MFTVRVEKKTDNKLDYDPLVSISTTGDVIIGEDVTRTLWKFSLQQDGSYSEQWRRQLPKNINCVSSEYRQYLTDTGDVILENFGEKSTTLLFDQDMKLKDSWQHKGEIIGCLPGPRAVYAVREAEGILVEIKSQNGESMQLKHERNALYMMGVCEDGRTGKVVVVQIGWEDAYFMSSMDIFSGVGKTKHQIIMQIEMCLESGWVKGNYHQGHK